MDSEKQTLTVVITPTAARELHDIWVWNAEHYSVAHAEKYLAYLRQAIGDLSSNYWIGLEVSTRPDLRYIKLRQKRRGHGHIAIFLIANFELVLLHVFHSAQDWQNILADELNGGTDEKY